MDTRAFASTSPDFSSTKTIARTFPSFLVESVPSARMATATLRPFRSTPSQLPWRTFQPRTAISPELLISLLEKQGPVHTSQVRASTYSPKIVGEADRPEVTSARAKT